MVSISHWGEFEEPERSWLDRGDGLPVFFSAVGNRENLRAGLREWAKERGIYADSHEPPPPDPRLPE